MRLAFFEREMIHELQWSGVHRRLRTFFQNVQVRITLEHSCKGHGAFSNALKFYSKESIIVYSVT